MKTITVTKIIKGGLIGILAFAIIAITVVVVNSGNYGMLIPAGIFMMLFGGIATFMLRKMSKSINVLTTGAPAKVTVLEVLDQEQKSTVKNDDFIWMLLRMRIDVEGRGSYELTQKETFPRLGSGYIQPNVVIPAMVDEKNHTKIEFLWIEFKRSIGK